MTRKNSAQKKKPVTERKAVLPQGAVRMISEMVQAAVPAAHRGIDPSPQSGKPTIRLDADLATLAAIARRGREKPGTAPVVEKAPDFESIVRRLIIAQGRTLTSLSRDIGRSKGFVSAMFAGTVATTPELVRQIALVLKTNELDALYSEPEPVAPPVAQSPDEPRLVPADTVGLPKSAEAPQSTSTAPEGLSVEQIIAQAAPSRIKSVRMTVTPALAKIFLQNNKSNRSLSVNHVQWFAKQIIDKQWNPDNGETIKFSPSGMLMDGQHRLHACVLANVDIEVDVLYGVPETSQGTIDVGRKRSIGDQLAISGEKYGSQVAAAVRWVHAIATGLTAYRTSTPEVQDFIARNPGLKQSVAYVRSQNATGTIPTLLCAIHYLGKHVLNEPEKADAFVQVFVTGYPAYEGDPAHRVREYYRDAREKGQVLTQAKQSAYVVHAWNLFRRRASVKSIRLPAEIRVDGFDPATIGVSTVGRISAQATTGPDGMRFMERV